MANDKKILELKNLIETAEIALQQAREILAVITGGQTLVNSKINPQELKKQETPAGQIIEGVFDGEKMIGPDGKEYSVPANYASKSKLVEGDMLKLTILQDGTFVYKQIGPQERERLKGKLIYDNESEGFRVITDNSKSYKLLTAAITYFKGEPGDEVIVLVPQGGECDWAAVENIIKKEDRGIKDLPATLETGQEQNGQSNSDSSTIDKTNDQNKEQNETGILDDLLPSPPTEQTADNDSAAQEPVLEDISLPNNSEANEVEKI